MATLPLPFGKAPSGGLVAGLGSAVSSLFTDGDAVRSSTGRLVGILDAQGTRYSRRKVFLAAKHLGIKQTADALDCDEDLVMEAVFLELTKKRKRRGLTYKQISQARRVSNTIKRMHKALCTTTRRK